MPPLICAAGCNMCWLLQRFFPSSLSRMFVDIESASSQFIHHAKLWQSEVRYMWVGMHSAKGVSVMCHVLRPGLPSRP